MLDMNELKFHLHLVHETKETFTRKKCEQIPHILVTNLTAEFNLFLDCDSSDTVQTLTSV